MQIDRHVPSPVTGVAAGARARIERSGAIPAHETALVDLRFRNGFQHDTVVVRSGYVELDRRVGLISNNGGPFAAIMHISAAVNSTLLIEAEALRARAWIPVRDIKPEHPVTVDLDGDQLHVSTEP